MCSTGPGFLGDKKCHACKYDGKKSPSGKQHLNIDIKENAKIV